MRRFLLSFGFLVFLAVFSAAFGWNYLERQFSALGPLPELRIVLIEKGAGTRQIAEQLEEAGVIKSAFLFRAGVRIFGRTMSLRAGEYSFSPGASVNEVLEKITSGKTVVHRLTIPEGTTGREALLEIEALTTLSGPLPPVPLEGTILPETYHFSRGDSREELLKRMSDAMTDAAAELWENRADGLPFNSIEEAIILASIVEKETAVAEERGLVAGVFVNRLRRGMRLQSDPTVVFGITLGKAPLGRALRRSDLKQSTPYNTYLVDGLPLGPIANPGRESLKAVLNPAATKFLYFVADGSGGHAFAETLGEHNRNVAHWRKIEPARRATAN